MSNFYKLHCEICNWTLVTDNAADVDGLYVYLRSKIQTKISHIDPETKKLAESKFMDQTKKFRCPKCGRLVSAKKAPSPQDAIEQQRIQLEREERERKLREEFEREERERNEKKVGVSTGRKNRPKRR